MLINLRNALMAGKKLPYDNEVEYLESTGTQWIDTGVEYAHNLKMEITYRHDRAGGTYQILSMIRNTDNRLVRGYFGFSFRSWSSFSFTAQKGSSGTTFTNAEAFNAVRTATMDANSATIYDSSGNVVASKDISSQGEMPSVFNGLKMPLFAQVTWNGSYITDATYFGQCRIYKVRYFLGDALVFDAIPVRKGTVGYLYDRVTGKLFGNAGTGDFVLGQDVVPVEYIESHGTEYIDTGTLVEMTDKVDCTFELLAYGDVTLAGGRVSSSTSSWAVWAYTNSVQCIRFDLIGNNGGSVVQSITPAIGREYKVSKIGLNNFVDGIRVNDNTSATYTPSRPCYLFAMNNGGTASFFGNYRIKDFSIGSKLKYRPVRVGTEGAMMDVLTRRIYRNAGTGAFTYGNDLKYPIPAE